MKPILLIPMAGKGQRFIDGGFGVPKQMIQVGSKSMLEWSLSCINTDEFECIFVARRDHVDEFQIDEFIKGVFGNEAKIVIAEYDTDGTVSSCLLARDLIDNDRQLSITTLDVYFEPNFSIHDMDRNYDGCILTFDANNIAYSYSEIDENGLVLRTAEKEVISNHASVGLYHFNKGSDFVKYADRMIEQNIRSKNEFYVCPLYNLLINDGLKIHTKQINTMNIMGTPTELEHFLENGLSNYE